MADEVITIWYHGVGVADPDGELEFAGGEPEDHECLAAMINNNPEWISLVASHGARGLQVVRAAPDSPGAVPEWAMR